MQTRRCPKCTREENSSQQISALFCAVRVENGEEVDRELWVLLEELQERNQSLAAENTALRARPPTGSWPCVPSCCTKSEVMSPNHTIHASSRLCIFIPSASNGV